jgi:hypothetical protein
MTGRSDNEIRADVAVDLAQIRRDLDSIPYTPPEVVAADARQLVLVLDALLARQATPGMTAHKHGVDGVDFCYTTPGELEQARTDAAAIREIRALHRPDPDSPTFHRRRECRECLGFWPCATILAALGGDPE